MSRIDLEIDGYELEYPPDHLDPELIMYLYDELRRLKLTVDHLVEAAIQTADKEPENPRRGTVRYNLSPWDPLSDGLEGQVMWNGSAWVAINTRA